jgi:hypothetical protein
VTFTDPVAIDTLRRIRRMAEADYAPAVEVLRLFDESGDIDVEWVFSQYANDVCSLGSVLNILVHG